MPTKSKTTEKAPPAEQRRAPQPDDKRPGEFEQGVHPTLALERAKVLPAAALKANDILALQRTIGNRAVQRLLSSQTTEPPVLQAKLMVGPAGDHYEQEADRMAHKVTSEPIAKSGAESIQRQTDEDEPVQRKPLAAPMASANPRSPDGDLAAVEPKTEAAIERAHGGGQPLPNVARAHMERAFGADFSRVRVHTDGAADQLNRSLQSRAFTTGQDLFFKRGEYNPNGTAGRELIAHELSHVMQQSKSQTKNAVIQRKVITMGTDQGPIGERDPNWIRYKSIPPAPSMIKDAYAPYTREEIINRVKEVETEKEWSGQEATRLRNKPLAAERLEKQWEAYRKAFSYWAEDGLSHSKRGVDDTKKKFVDEKKKWEKVEAVEERLEVVHKGKSAELKPYQEILDGIPWRETYATKPQRDRIKVLRDEVKPRVDDYKGRLTAVAKSRAELAEVSLLESEDKITTAKEKIRLAEENNPARNRPLRQGAQKLVKLVKKLDKAISTQLKEMLKDAKRDHKLDIKDDEIDGITKKMMAAKVPKSDLDERRDSAKKRIKDAVTLQHKPTRRLWYGELGLSGDNPAMAEEGTIGEDPVHASLYNQPAFKEPSSSQDITSVAVDRLQDDLLGRGTTGYHLTIDQKRGSSNHPHAYRGGPVRMNYYLEKSGTTPEEAEEDLIAKRDASVKAVEDIVKDIHENKGMGVNTLAVKGYLTP